MARIRSQYHAGTAHTRSTALVDLTEKYLERYGAPESSRANLSKKQFSHVLVIPAYQESLSRLEKVWANISPALIIIVVNSPDQNDPVTGQLLKDIELGWTNIGREENCAWYEAHPHTCLVVDRCTTPLSKGVGEARKIGADIALGFIASGVVHSDLIYHTDADAVLPADYFASAELATSDKSFVFYPFGHTGASVAASLYEFSLIWYAFGLQQAGSVYAHTSIGSTIACRADAYAAVRGWPLRSAGEDFYLLNKLRKIGAGQKATGQPIKLSSRESDRVPFGTGPGVKKIEALDQPLESYGFYHPRCFAELRTFLSCLHTSHGARALESHFPSQLHYRFLEETGLEKLIKDKQTQKPAVFDKFLLDWFDGFRTLKFVHFVRDHAYPSVPFASLWQSELLPMPCPGTSSHAIQSASLQLWEALG